MSDRFERDARWIRLAVWSGALVVLAVTGAMTINIIQKNRLADHREAAAMATDRPVAKTAAPATAPPTDYDAYERANAERNSEQIAREAAAYDAYRAAHQPPAETPRP